MTVFADQTPRPIAVLLVDDNEQWANFLRDDLERQDDRLAVTVALSANEAMVTIAEDTIDVVVADYRMPEVDGLQLLERIREEQPLLPFILVTAAGSEEVAATAIEAGVSDYLVKNPNTDQTPLLAQRIHAAYEQFRLRQQLRQSEQRYRTVVERSHDAIGIIQEGRLRYHNDRLVELTGYDSVTLEGIDFVETLIHEGDRDAVQSSLAVDDPAGTLLEVRLLTAAGEPRDGEFALAPIVHDGEPAVLVSIRDATRRKRREERIERERRLNRGIFDALVELSTRSEIEDLVVQEFVDHGYALAWIGEPADKGVIPRASAGRDEYLSRLTTDGTIGDTGEPAVIAARTGDARFIQDVRDLLDSNWREAVNEISVRSVAALPVSYDGVRYGILAVYHERPGRFDETERELLVEAARTLGFAIHHVETRRALGADAPVRVELSLDREAYSLSQTLATPSLDTSRVRTTVHGTHAGTDGRTIQYLSVSGATDEVAAALRSAPGIIDVMALEGDGESRFQVTMAERPVESLLTERGARVERTIVTPDGATVVFSIGDRTAVGDVVDAIQARHGPAHVESITDAEPPRGGVTHPVDLGRLTDKQLAALEAARQHGYFNQPRGASATEIATALDVSHSTYLQHLRAAQRKLTEQLFKRTDIE